MFCLINFPLSRILSPIGFTLGFLSRIQFATVGTLGFTLDFTLGFLSRIQFSSLGMLKNKHGSSQTKVVVGAE